VGFDVSACGFEVVSPADSVPSEPLVIGVPPLSKMAWAWVMACWMEAVDVMLETILENGVLAAVSLIIVATSAAACSAA
jgi:hypothetical protein